MFPVSWSRFILPSSLSHLSVLLHLSNIDWFFFFRGVIRCIHVPWRLLMCLHLCTRANVSVCIFAGPHIMVNIRLWTVTVVKRNWDVLAHIPVPAHMFDLTHPHECRVIEALMQSYYPHNLKNPPHLLSIYSPPLFSCWAIHRCRSSSWGNQLSPLLVFPLYRRAMINLQDIFPMGFHRINGYFGASLSRNELVCRHHSASE